MTRSRLSQRLFYALLVRQRQRERLAQRTGSRRALRLSGAAFLSLLLLSAMALGLLASAAATVYAAFTRDLPDPEAVEATVTRDFQTTRLYDRSGQYVLYEAIDPNAGDRTWVNLANLPAYVPCATVAIEDRTFWENPGINPRGLLRAFLSNLEGNPIQGGSSITQQVIKNSVIPEEERYQQSYQRKIKEILLALELTRRYSKAQILEWYLNTNFYGNLAYGIDAAARVYFGKSASELTINEAATLAAIPQYPRINPFDAPEEARQRRDLVLDAMVLEGCITREEAEQARSEPWQLASRTVRFDIQAPHFALAVRQQLEAMYGPEMVAGGGLRVYTTLDLAAQQQAECVTRAYLQILKGAAPAEVITTAQAQGCSAAAYLPDIPEAMQGKDLQVNNAAVIVLNPRTGEVVALVGSADYWDESIDGHFNVAIDGRRQPGSAFKPFTYVTFLAQGGNAAHVFYDVRRAFTQPNGAPYVPENYDRRYNGPVTLRQALARSLNIPAVEAMAIAGVGNVLRTAHRMGINTLDEGLDYYGLSLTLGGGEVSLLDLTYAYSVFANQGLMIGSPVPESQRRSGYRELDPVFILRVEDRNGKVLYQYQQPEMRPILDARLAYIITDILADRAARRPAFGSPNALELSNDRPAAAKTGTTNDYVDNWTVGYTPQYAVGVWMGNTDNRPMTSLPGSRGAAYIWHAVMEYLHHDLPIEAFPRPDGLIEVQVCPKSGLLPNGHCPVITELMIPGTEPRERCQVHQVFEVNKETGRLATIYTPRELVEKRTYEVYPPEVMEWINTLPENRRPPIPPTEYDTIYGPNLSLQEVAILTPTAYSYVQGLLPIYGNAHSAAFQTYRLYYGKGLNPATWTQIGADHEITVTQGLLETWDLTDVPNGLYTLRLQVINTDLSVQEHAIQVTVDKTPPKVSITYPEAGAVFTLGQQEWINVNAEVSDNYAISRVEFYVGASDQPFAVRTVAPYNVNWTPKRAGTYKLRVVAYDAAGNSASAWSGAITLLPKP